MITDDELLLYYYRDGLDAAERARIGAALSEQPELAQRLQASRGAPRRGRGDARSSRARGTCSSAGKPRWSARHAGSSRMARARCERGRHWTFDGAAAAAVAVVALIWSSRSRRSHRRSAPPRVSTERRSRRAGDASAYERGLKVHLASTEQQLAGLDSATPEERARLIETIIAQNRIYALAAERAGEPQLARVLRAFSPVLESLAHDGGDSSASIAQLGFELRVMQGRLSAGADHPTPHPPRFS